MRKSPLKWIVLITVLFSCGQARESPPGVIKQEIDKSQSTEHAESQNSVAISTEQYIDTRYEYPDSDGKNLIIENSLPKGGLKYTDPEGKEYVYAVFWTQVINDTGNPYELALKFPVDSFDLPSSPGNFFKIVLPSEKMTMGKAPMFNYGLTDLGSVLDDKIHNPSLLQKTINSKESHSFYVVTLFKKGVEGTVRSGLSLKDGKLYYRVNDKEIYCGEFKIKNLKLQR